MTRLRITEEEFRKIQDGEVGTAQWLSKRLLNLAGAINAETSPSELSKLEGKLEAVSILAGRLVQRRIPVTPAGLKRLQRNAADPAKARKKLRQRLICPDCLGGGSGTGLHGGCERCRGTGSVGGISVADATREREHVQPAIEDYLRAEGLVVIPINSGAATIIGGRACLKGVPDLMTWIPQHRIFMGSLINRPTAIPIPSRSAWAVICFCECKRPKGGRYSKEQIGFRARAQADGCLWIGATSVEDVKAVIPPKGRR